MNKIHSAIGALSFALLAASPALAENNEAPQASSTSDSITGAEEERISASDIVVLGKINMRNRTEATEPTLVYDQEYFQRFEPLTAGDALKRVPSVTFLSDVIESDGARLRGLAPGYTQILINGEKVPGSNADRSFFMDRIPAELISRVEIVRSSSARRSGDAMAGTLNIVLRDGFQLDGGYIRAGALHFDDGKWKPSAGLVWGGEVGPGRLLLGANLQGRYNPKQKKSLRYGDSPENNPDFATEDFDNREDQRDTRNGTDYSANATYDLEWDNTKASLSAFIVRTDRTEDERSHEYDDPAATTGPVRAPGGHLLSDNSNVAEIDQLNYSLGFKVAHEWGVGKTSFKLGYASFDEKRYETEYEIDFDRATPRFTGDLINDRIKDNELSAKLEHEFRLGEEMDLVIGGFMQAKDRDMRMLEQRDRRNVAAPRSWNQFTNNPNEFARPFDRPAFADGGLNTVREDRRDIFGLIEGKSGGLSWEAGLRYETTDYRITDRTAVAVGQVYKNDYDMLLPSASLKYDIGAGRITASVARTNRRPDFKFLSPAVYVEEYGDSDLIGNSFLKPESAWGVDFGYEHRLGRTGVAGINFFYRDVKNLNEIRNTGEHGEAYEAPTYNPDGSIDDNGTISWVFQPHNAGNGKVYGVEFDLSTDLGFIGLPDTGIFGNVSWLDSEISDFMGKRRFNGQSSYVYNIGFIQDIPSLGVAFGATHRKQGKAFDRVVSEEIVTTYGADLEVFVEKRFGKMLTLRAVGQNLLNGAKKERFNKFTSLEDQLARDFDEYELESEKAGPVFQVMARLAF